MTPTALILALTITILPPDPTTGPDGPRINAQEVSSGLHDSGTGEGGDAWTEHPGPAGVRSFDRAPHVAVAHPCEVAGACYVHALGAPAVDVTGLDPQFLAESVPIMLAESRGNNAAKRTDVVAGRPYTSYCILQILVDGATGPLIERMGGTVQRLQDDPAFCLAVGQEWKRLTDNGVPWRKWTTRGKYVPVPVVGTDSEAE